MPDPVICVDLSSYQKGFNFEDFKAGGGLGVILKASEGSFRDPDYSTFWDQAIDAGLAVGSYHFLRPGDMNDQASFLLNVVKPRQGERVVADYEIAGISLDDLVTFLQAIRTSRPDLQLTIYSGYLIKQQLGKKRNAWLANNTSLWLAQYTTGEPSWPTATWPNWSLWQYTSQGTVAGFSRPLDCNRFDGANANFLKWMGPPSGTA
jgi:lysozyme